MPLGYQTVCYGNVQSTFGLKINVGTVGAITLSSTGNTTVNVPGLLTSDQVSVSKPTIQTGLAVVGAVCLTNGVLTIQYMNASIANITPTAGELYTIEVNRYLDTLPSSIQ